MKNIKRVAILVALLFLLAACGGGNSAVLDLGSAESSEPEPSETPTPVPATTTSASNPGVRSYNCLNDTSFKNLQADIAKQETTVETSPAGDKANEEDKLEALKARLAECEKEREASEPSEESTPPPDDGEMEVQDADGEFRTLPLVDQTDGAQPTVFDTTQNPASPATFTVDARGWRSWKHYADEMRQHSWYTDAADRFANRTKFNWDDVERFADAADDIDARIITVHNMSPDEVSEQQARDSLRPWLGDDVNHMHVEYIEDCIGNTRGHARQQVSEFVDCRKMVRAGLAPIVFDDDGEPMGIRADAGVFLDCLNFWWKLIRTPRTKRVEEQPSVTTVVTHQPKPQPPGKHKPPAPAPKPKPKPKPKPGGKNPAESRNNDPGTPAQVKKTAPSSDNASRVADGPNKPIDSPNGKPQPQPAPKPAAPAKPADPPQPSAGTGAPSQTGPPPAPPAEPPPPASSSPTTNPDQPPPGAGD